MSHQVLLSFDIDENKVQENAEKEAARQIVKEMMGSGNAYYGAASVRMREYIKDILTEAVKEVVGNLHKTKAVKEKLQETLQ